MSHNKKVGRPKKLNLDTTDMREYQRQYQGNYKKHYKQFCDICDCTVSNMTAHKHTSKHKKNENVFDSLKLFLRQIPEQQQLVLLRLLLNKYEPISDGSDIDVDGNSNDLDDDDDDDEHV